MGTKDGLDKNRNKKDNKYQNLPRASPFAASDDVLLDFLLTEGCFGTGLFSGTQCTLEQEHIMHTAYAQELDHNVLMLSKSIHTSRADVAYCSHDGLS